MKTQFERQLDNQVSALVEAFLRERKLSVTDMLAAVAVEYDEPLATVATVVAATIVEQINDAESAVRADERDRLAEFSADEEATGLEVAYGERNRCVYLIVLLAQALGLRVGMGRHIDKEDVPWDDEWRNVVYVDLPSGQVSWHIHDSEMTWGFDALPKYPDPWDGHTTSLKYRRLRMPEPLPDVKKICAAERERCAELAEKVGTDPALGMVTERSDWKGPLICDEIARLIRGLS